ncbi:MAG TPA: GNAT family N-acetyltransferase [Nocardioidaceae bacterium]|nr:GNAT family N-acetyltransferase [Nocardioidaceae bacterium]
MQILDLPYGLTSRALAMDDAKAVFDVAAAQELHDVGKVEIEPADIVADWQRPSWDVSTHTVGVFDDQSMVAYAEITGADRCDSAVHPSYRGRGLGTTLARWLQRRGRELGSTVLGSPVPQGSAGDRLLESLGYRVRWTSWVLVLPEDRVIEPRQLPEGYAVRAARPEDYPAVHTVIEDAFLEWSVRERTSYDDFLATSVQRPGFEPWNLRVVTGPTGEVLGAALVIKTEPSPSEAYVDQLAVRRDQRHQGLAQALLVDAFAQGREHGAERSTLSTDSRTGALGLYRKVGMQIEHVWVNRAIEL